MRWRQWPICVLEPLADRVEHFRDLLANLRCWRDRREKDVSYRLELIAQFRGIELRATNALRQCAQLLEQVLDAGDDRVSGGTEAKRAKLQPAALILLRLLERLLLREQLLLQGGHVATETNPMLEVGDD